VAVLLTVYANCIDGQEEVVNDRIGAALEQGRSVGASWGSHPDRPAASDESAGQA
jgi:hypothetical protein